MGKELGKYSFGTGDRFGREGEAQLKAILMAEEAGVNITPVWNKSHREHLTVNSGPESVREEADEAVKNLNYKGDYFVDADHIDLKIVNDYIPVSDFFTIDVADFIGQELRQEDKKDFLKFVEKYTTEFLIPGIKDKIRITPEELEEIINTFLFAAKKASEVHEHISSEKKSGFSVEVSMDEVANPQTPKELFFVLAALAFYQVPVNTIAPKFTGRFNKGVDYEGDLKAFEQEFERDIFVIAHAIREFDLPKNLKLSIHSGSDKFSIYPVMNRIIKKHNTGLHVKTAGTTWVEEITTIAESGETGFKFALKVYEEALARFAELTSSYPDVLEIDTTRLPSVENLKAEGGEGMAKTLRHDPSEEKFNPHFRQLMHCAYKIAGEKQDEFSTLLKKHREEIEKNVTANLFEKHIKPIFLD